MKTALFLTALLVAGSPFSQAEIPEPVRVQIRADTKAAMQARDASVSDEKIAKETAAFEKAVAEKPEIAASYAFTAAEVEAFKRGTPTPTDDEMKKAVTEITAMLSDPKLPLLLAYYETLRVSNKLTPAQRILHLRTCRVVMANLKKHSQAK